MWEGFDKYDNYDDFIKHTGDLMTSLIKSAYFNREDLLQLFNLKNENILDIDVSHQADGVYVSIKLIREKHNCPVCGSGTDKVKDYTSKKILHSLLTNYPCFIMYQARRYVCLTCKKTFYENNPFVHKNMKISVVTVSNVLQDLKLVGETFTSVGKRYGITSTTAAAIFDSHVFISRKVLPPFLCIDECYAFSGDDGNYVCVLIDFVTKNTIDLLPSRKIEDLIKYFDLIPLEERKKVQMICIDMWETYRTIAHSKLPNCAVALDKFHVLQDLHRKVKRVRINIMNQIKPLKITSKLEYAAKHNDKDAKIKLNDYMQRDINYYLLKKFDWLLFLNYEKRKTILDLNLKKKMNHKLRRYCNYNDLLALILNIDPQLKEAYYFLLNVDTFFREANYADAKYRLNKIIDLANQSCVSHINEFGHTLMRWRIEIINSFYIIETVDEFGEVTSRKMNNGIAENTNRKLKLIKNHSNGYKSWDRFRNRALYVLNDDATYSLNPLK